MFLNMSNKQNFLKGHEITYFECKFQVFIHKELLAAIIFIGCTKTEIIFTRVFSVHNAISFSIY